MHGRRPIVLSGGRAKFRSRCEFPADHEVNSTNRAGAGGSVSILGVEVFSKFIGIIVTSEEIRKARVGNTRYLDRVYTV